MNSNPYDTACKSVRILEGPKQAQSAPVFDTLRAGNPTNALVKCGDREAEPGEKNAWKRTVKLPAVVMNVAS